MVPSTMYAVHATCVAHGEGGGPGEGGGHDGGHGHHDAVLHLQRTLHKIGDRELTTFLAYGAHLAWDTFF